ncbi:MAG TPA: hypothetical protein PKK43_13980, partial [Spirochaetota bacterium]|nr:hypothetical protein [Spirochaetota bacterium]
RIDNRIKAVVNLDGSMYGDVFSSGLSVPLLLMKNAYVGGIDMPDDSMLADMELTLDEYKNYLGDLRDKEQQLWNCMTADSYDMIIRQSGHYNFTDLPYFQGSLLIDDKREMGLLSAERGTTIIRRFVETFLSKYLRREGDFVGDNNTFSEVVINKRS